MSKRTWKGLILAVVDSLRWRSAEDEAEFAAAAPTSVAGTGPVARVEVGDSEITQPLGVERPVQRRTQRLQVPTWEQPTARTDPELCPELPAYLTPLPESLPQPSEQIQISAPVSATTQTTLDEPITSPEETAHTRRTKPYEIPGDLDFLDGLS